METAKTITRTSRKNAGRALLVLGLLLLLAAGAAQAQPNLNFKRVLVDWPTVELYFSAGCNGQPYFNLRPSDFRILENGNEVKDFTLYCPDPRVRCPISVSLVFDASGSMQGAGNAGAKQAGHTFIDLMDGLIDEAALLHFTQVVTTQQQMTADRALLHTATEALPAFGATAVWDGTYAGIIELINNGRNQCRAVIVLTDGGDNSSTRTVAEIISRANRNRIRVYTVGLGTSINATELEQIALLTGGRYYQTPDASQIAAIYTEIAYSMFQGFQECMISYQQDCANGAMRHVELQLVDVCGGSDAKVRTYRAPLDPNTTQTIPFHLTGSDCIADEETVVRMYIDADTTMTLSPFDFIVTNSKSYLQLLSVSVPPGSPLQGQTVELIDNSLFGTLVRIPRDWSITGPAPLLDFRFRAILPTPSETIRSVLVQGGDLNMRGGCFRGDFTQTTFTIRRFAPKLNCALSIPAVVSPPGSQAYQPMPVPVTCEVSNDGNVASDSVDVTLLLPPGLAPAPGEMLKKRLQPPLLQTGAMGTVSWNVVFALTQEQRRYRIEAVASQRGVFAASPCGDTLVVPPLDGLRLEARCAAPDSLTYDPNILQYSPNPFDLRVLVWNRGVSAVRNATVRLELPDGLELDPPSQPATRSLAPSTLQPWNTGDHVPVVTWTVRWTKNSPFEERPMPRFVLGAEDMNGHVIDTIATGCEIRVPPVPTDWVSSLITPDSLGRNGGGYDVEPNPFEIAHTVTNTSRTAIRIRQVRLVMPDAGIEVDALSLKPAVLPFDTLIAPGFSLETRWLLRVLPRNVRRQIPLEVIVDAEGTSPIVSGQILPVAALPAPRLRCHVSVSGIAIDSLQKRYIPAPFQLSANVINEGRTAAANVTAVVRLPSGFHLASADSTARLLQPRLLGNAMNAWTTWSVWADSRLDGDTATIVVDFLADNPVNTACGGEVILPAMRGLITPVRLSVFGETSFCEGDSVTLDAGAEYLSYSWSNGRKTRRIVATQSGSYWCAVNTIEGWRDHSDTVSVAVWPRPETPVISRLLDRLEAPAAAHWQWERDGALLPDDTLRTLPLPGTGSYRVRVTSAAGCDAWSDPYEVTVLSARDDAPAPHDGSIAGFGFYPNPVSGVLTVDVTLRAAAASEITLHDLLGREVRRQSGPRDSRNFSTRLDVGDLEPGLYMLTLQVDGERRALPVVVEVQR
ncbi:MAG: VWA domain-containing protein [Bacteroidetes bacterium]|nr:VWA domain-containing protein [Bacteroidota bacterium]